MGRLFSLIARGEVLRQEDEAAECRRIEIQEAFATYGAGRQAERQARIAAGWDRTMASIVPEYPDEEPAEGDDDKKKDPPVQFTRRRRRRGRRHSGSSAAFAQTDTEGEWDEAMKAAASDAPGAAPPAAETDTEESWDGALRETAAPTGSSSPHMFGRARHALAGRWRSMFST